MRLQALHIVKTMIDECADGTGGSVHIQAMPGMGKTATLRHAREYARERGLLVLSARARERDAYSPLSLLVRAFDSPEVLGDAGQLTPERLDAAVDRVDSLSLQRGVVILLDDLHWLDRPTTVTLRGFMDELAGSPVLWLLAARPAAPGSAALEAESWLSRVTAAHVVLNPLDDDETDELVTEMVGAPPSPALRTWLARCGGNPYLLRQTLSGLQRGGALTIHHGIAHAATADYSTAQVDLISLGLDLLSPDAHLLVSALSVLDRPFEPSEGCHLTGLSWPQTVAALEEGIRAGALVKTEDGRLSFAHEITREFLLDSLSGPRRDALNLAASTRFDPAPEDTTELSAAPAASDVMLETAEQMETSSPSVAATLLLRALELMDDQDPRRRSSVVRAVRLLASAARVDEAERLERAEVNETYSATDRARAALGTAESLKHRGGDREAAELIKRHLAEPGLADAERADLLALLAHCLLNHGSTDGRDVTAAEEAARLAERSGNRSAHVYALAALSAARLQDGEIEDGLVVAEKAVATASDDPHLQRIHPERWHGRLLVASDRLDAALVSINAAQQRASALGTAWTQPMWHFDRSELLLARGQFSDALVEAETGVRVARTSAAHALMVPLLSAQALAQLNVGDVEHAERSLREAKVLLDSGAVANPGYVDWGLVVLTLMKGDTDALAPLLTKISPTMPNRRSAVIVHGLLGISCLRAMIAAGSTTMAAHCARLFGEIATRNPNVMSRRAFALHADGVVHGDPTRIAEARDLYVRAGRYGHLGWCALDLATASRDQPDEAASHFTAAREIFTRQGAEGALQFGDRLSRGAGVTMSQPVEHDDVWDTLTKSELKVLNLVVAGMTNRQTADELYLSRHTVDTHLRHIFEKIGVTSRVRLSSAYHARFAAGLPRAL